MNILVTGGAGYIGSHTCLALLEEGHEVCVIDNFSNSSNKSLLRVQELAGRGLTFNEGDILDGKLLDSIFQRHDIDSVIHFAGLKAVGESSEIPLAYYENNIAGTLSLLKSMQRSAVRKLVFSSSATVYGDPESLPITETCALSATNPYGRTKLFIEQMLIDLAASSPDWKISILRYFNPVGAHPSGRIGEHPQGKPNNLVPFISQVAVGQRDYLSIFGGDYQTPDGTGVRDYIHVVDLAKGHLKALQWLETANKLGIHNLGTGNGYSVLEVLRAFEAVVGKPIPYRIEARRVGDIAECFADPGLAKQELGWTAEHGLKTMIEDAWRWQSANPQGYDS